MNKMKFGKERSGPLASHPSHSQVLSTILHDLDPLQYKNQAIKIKKKEKAKKGGKINTKKQKKMSKHVSVSWQFAILLFLLLAIGSRLSYAGSAESIPTPTPWPERFNALLFTNHTITGGVKLQMNDLWYDWPNRRTMNRIQYQLGDYLRDVEWNNGTSYYFTNGPNGTCTTRLFPVGVLAPEWLEGATYVGRRWIEGFECHVFTKVDFIIYYEEVGTGRPVHWYFTDGMSMHVMTFEVGAVLDESEWQAPEYCFTESAETENVEIIQEEVQDMPKGIDSVNVLHYLHFRKFSSM